MDHTIDTQIKTVALWYNNLYNGQTVVLTEKDKDLIHAIANSLQGLRLLELTSNAPA